MKEKKPNHLLRRERELRGWSQKVVAERIGTDPQTVTRWEIGENRTGKYFQTKLTELFGKSAEELGFIATSSTPNKEPQTEHAPFTSSNQGDEFQEILSLLTSHGILSSGNETRGVDKLRKLLLLDMPVLTVEVPIGSAEFILQCTSTLKACWFFLKHYACLAMKFLY